MKNKALQIGPKDALCALFLLIRESGRPSLAEFSARLGCAPLRLQLVVDALRKQGLVDEEELGLTFLGLATAAALLPSSRIEQDGGRMYLAA